MVFSKRCVPTPIQPRGYLLGLIAASGLALICQPGLAAAQTTVATGTATQVPGSIGGAGFTVVSLATSGSANSSTIGFLWRPGSTQATYQLVRMMASGSTNIPVTPGNLGPFNVFIDTPPSGTTQVCYQLRALGSGNAVLGTSDVECVILGVANGAVPGAARITLNQGTTATIAWDAVAGADRYLVWSLGTDGVAIVTDTTANLQSLGGIVCGVILPMNAQGAFIGSSNVLCGFPGFATVVPGPITPTPTSVSGSTTATPSLTVLPTGTPTITGTPATGTPTETVTGTPPTSTPTQSVTGTPPTGTPTQTTTGTPPTASATASATETRSVTTTPTLSLTVTRQGGSPTPTITQTLGTITPTPTITQTGTPPTATSTLTGTPPTVTPTQSGTPPTATPAQTGTPTATVTGTPPTSTPTVTGTPPTNTPTVTGTLPTATSTITGTPPTATSTVTGTPPTATMTTTGTPLTATPAGTPTLTPTRMTIASLLTI